MGSGDSKAELATVELAISIVFPPQVLGWWSERENPMQGEILPFLLVSSTNTAKQPSSESTPIPWLITGDKDKERREEGTGEHSGEGWWRWR